jgi:tetratricopeptide (TPR) repeat protein
MQQYLVAPLFTQVRFGQWDAILAQAQPASALPYPTGVWHFARGMAQLRRGDTAAASRELEALQATARDPGLAKVTFFDINSGDRVLAVAEAVLRGELALRRAQRAAGLAALREAAAAEDRLSYNEPADWPLPVRAYLGAALLDADRAREAAQAYREDLTAYPDNGWSLYGLAQAQRALGDSDGARQSEQRLAAAWQWADTPLHASRM